jgi:cell division protein FtsA
MSRMQQIVGLDIGSSKVRVVVVQLGREETGPSVLGIGEAPMLGMQKGVVSDVEEAVASVSRALDAAERMAGVPIERAYVSINGSHISSQNSRGVIAVSRADGEITAEDVARVINAAQAISLPTNREILHVLPQGFIVDGQEQISDPVGMTGVRLEVEGHIVEGSTPFIKNLTKVVNQAGVHVEDFVFAPLAAGYSNLDKRQKDLGVIIVDLGAGTTSLAVYEEGVLLHTAVLPFGSSHITNDIAIGLRTSIDVAEAIKLEYGTANVAEAKGQELKLSGEGVGEQETVSREEVANIISARLEEILSFIDKELKKIQRSGLLPAGAVFTGQGAKLPGVIEMAKKRLRLPARIAKPKAWSGVAQNLDDPAWAVALGLVYWGLQQEKQATSRPTLSMPDMGQTVGKLRNWFKNFLP